MAFPLLTLISKVQDFQRAEPKSQVWIAAHNLDSQAHFGWGENEKVRTASTIKLPILCALYQGVHEQKWKLDERITLHEADKAYGSGILREFTAGVSPSLQDLAHLMIVVSDNTATNLILERISAEYVNHCLDQWGFPATRSMRKVLSDPDNPKMDPKYSRAGMLPENRRYGLGSSTSAEMIALLGKLDKGEIVSTDASREVLDILDRQHYKDGIGRRLALKMKVVSKSGGLDALRSDVGIVYSPGGKIAIAITVDGMSQVDYSTDNAGKLLIAEISDLLVEGLANPA